MVELNVKSLVIGMALGVLLCFNLTNSFCNTSAYFDAKTTITTTTTSNDAPPDIPPSEITTTTSTTTTSSIPSSSSGSFTPDPVFQRQYDEIDKEDMAKKCERYNLKYNPSTAGSRRIFFGSMVANDAIEMLRMHATEAYGLYDVMVLSESNTTHTGTPRDMRFIPGKEGYEFMMQEDGAVWGPNTKIRFSYWLEKAPNLMYMARERTQRNTIVQGWIQEGITPNDIAIMSDMDETFTRDYLWAIKMCEPPDYILNMDCKKVKVLGNCLVFQSSPECISERSWYHPDWALGQCIEGVGDDSFRVKRKRNSDEAPACGGGNYCRDGRSELYDADQIRDGMYPLSTGTDLRELPQGNMANVWNRDESHTHTAFHFHNMFADLVKLRHKYATYAHGSEAIAQRALGLIEHDLDVVVRCAHGYPNEINPEGRKRQDEGFTKFRGSKPIYFVGNGTYVKERHTALVHMMAEDEAKYGKTYNDTYVGQFMHSKT